MYNYSAHRSNNNNNNKNHLIVNQIINNGKLKLKGAIDGLIAQRQSLTGNHVSYRQPWL